VRLLIRLYGWPHEGLHALALLLIGRRALHLTQTRVDLPPDLSDGQYVFVAGLPALVFWGGAALAMLGLLRAATWGQAGLAFAVLFVMGIGGVSTLGDIYLILNRLLVSHDPDEF
jgi:hypothetical protein